MGTLTRLRPDIVFIAGDMYDGTIAKVNELAAPLAKLAAPWGAYFVTGNHEEFSDPTKYLDAVQQSGVRVLNNEKVTIDGLQIVGVHYRDSTNDERFRAVLREAAVDRGRASILLTHAPDRLKITEEEGFSLQLSGHTHGGQFFPFTWITSRLYGKFVHGLQRLGNLLVYTSYGAGTWGPPLRVGTKPEIVPFSSVDQLEKCRRREPGSTSSLPARRQSPPSSLARYRSERDRIQGFTGSPPSESP